MTNKINLIELLSLFSPCGDFPSSNYKINVCDFANPLICTEELLRDFLKTYFDSRTDLIFNAPVERFWIDPESEILTVYIDSSEYKSTCDDFIKLKTLVELLDSRQTIRITYWSLRSNSTAVFVPDCSSSRHYPNLEIFLRHEMQDRNAFVTNLTVQHSVKDNSYMLIINAFDSTTLTRLHELADYKKKTLEAL